VDVEGGKELQKASVWLAQNQAGKGYVFWGLVCAQAVEPLLFGAKQAAYQMSKWCLWEELTCHKFKRRATEIN